MKTILATLLVCALFIGAAGAQAPQKKYKDQGEYDAFVAVTKDMAANDPAKALADLDAWRQKYPETDFRSDRDLLYVQAYSAARQPAKAVDAARELVAKGADSAGSPANAVKLLFTTAVSIQQLPEPAPEQLATGEKAARELLTYDKKPEGVTDDAWAQARTQLQSAARGALLYTALLPGTQALQKKDCAAAETLFQKAIGEHPDSAQAAYYLGMADICLYKTQPEKASAGIFAIARAAVSDPVKGGVDPNWQKNTVAPYLAKIYNDYHGPDPEGLARLKELAAQSPLPPADFKIKSKTHLAQEKEAEFETSNPQLAMWLRIKGALADANGDQYFASTLKDSAVPQLKGVLVEARPACRPTELLVAVPLPEGKGALQPEIRLKLDKALAGKPAPETEFRWQGIPAEFTQSPFLLTMDTESAKVEGLNLAPCAAGPARRGPVGKKQ
jgi:hypothetical protein